MSRNGFDRGASFVRSLVSKHGFANHVADGINGGIIGLQLLVHLNKSARAQLNLRFVQARNFRIRLAPDRD